MFYVKREIMYAIAGRGRMDASPLSYTYAGAGGSDEFFSHPPWPAALAPVSIFIDQDRQVQGLFFISVGGPHITGALWALSSSGVRRPCTNGHPPMRVRIPRSRSLQNGFGVSLETTKNPILLQSEITFPGLGARQTKNPTFYRRCM